MEQEAQGDSTPSQFLKCLQKLAVGTEDKSIVRHIFLQQILAQYKVALTSLDESIPVELLVSVEDHIADLLSIHVSAVTCLQAPDLKALQELKEGQQSQDSRMNKMAEDLVHLSFKYNHEHSNCHRHSKECEQKPIGNVLE